MSRVREFLIFSSLLLLTDSITISKVSVRMPKPNDIGLIFDLTVANNDGSGKKEKLEFSIRSDGYCKLNLRSGLKMKKAGRIVGGKFGFLDIGSAVIISLIWPTVSLYNRLGCCPVRITTVGINGEQTQFKQVLHFDTKLTTLDPDGNSLRSRKDYRDCKNFDQDYFKNCTPVNCEERYFGKRSYYNKTSEKCESVPKCHGARKMYDMYTNHCIDTQQMVLEEDIASIQQRIQFEDWKDIRNLQSSLPNHRLEGLKNEDAFEDKRNDALLYLRKTESNEKAKLTEEPDINIWTKIMDGLLIVCGMICLQVIATILIYLIICFLIFLITTWISRCHANITTTTQLHDICSESDSILTVRHSSLLSQR